MYKVCIDAGHGLNTPGKRCAKQLDHNETREWVLNSKIAEKVCLYLERSGIETLRLDDVTGLIDVHLEERTDKCNQYDPDLLVSIHHDAGAELTAAGGTTVFVYNGLRSVISDILQENIYNEFLKSVGNFGNRSDGTLEKNLHMVREPKCPAVLIECGFMDSLIDTPMILTEKFSKNAAIGITKGICKTLGVEFKEESEMDVNKEVFDLSGTGKEHSEWAENAVEWAKKEGLFVGDKDGNYGWKKAVTREQLAFILYNFSRRKYL